MEFGKVSDISSINWSLPSSDPKNLSHLKNELNNNNSTKIFFGSPAWGAKHFLGKIYPPKTKSEDFLYYYALNFTCIELNTTHYRIPTQEVAKEWISKVTPAFLFCPKVSKEISHTRLGLYDKNTLALWLNFLVDIKDNLGPCFIQMHELFSYKDKAALFHFLEQWPSEFRLSLELRHPSWFQNGVILPALTDYLHRKNIGLVITDVAGRRDVLHSSLSTPWTMIRLIGNDLDSSDELRLNNWAQRLEEWQQNGLKETFLFLHQPDDVMTIEFSTLAEKIFSAHNFQNIPHISLQSPNDLLSFL